MAAAPSPSPTDLNGEKPWPGLASFTEDARQFFHGRTQEVDALFRHVRRRLLTTLFGQSGLGKSSLLQAGLFPRLRREGFLPIYLRLDHAPDAPAYGEQIKAGLVRALTEAGVGTLPGGSESVWEFFHRRELSLDARDGLPVTPVFVLDQFEEIFTLTHGDTETKARAGRLLNALADLVENRVPAALEERMETSPELSERYEFRREDYRLILSLREDYLPHLESLRELIPSLMQNRMRLHRMNGEQAREAVLRPGGDLVAPPVAEAILRFVSGARLDDPAVDVAGMEIEPPLLSLVCHELNNQRLALGHAQITTDLLAGSSTGILRDFYERCLADQPPAVRRFVEDDLLTDSGFRENVALERAQKALARDDAPADAIARLVDRRLLHVEERLNLRRVELTHDVLAGVVRASRDSRRAREEKDLADRRALEAERRERDARRHLWRARRAIAVTALLLVAALVAGALAFAGQRKATRAEHAAQTAEARAHEDEAKFRRMAIQADYTFATDALARDDAATGIAYLGRILRTAPGEGPAAALLWSILRDRNWCLPLLPPLTHADGLNTAEFSPDGTEIVTASKDGSARLWDARTGAPIGEALRHTANVFKAVFSPDGRRVATASNDGTARVWDARTGRPVTPPIRHEGGVGDVAFSPDGRWVATASDDATAGMWEVETGRTISPAWPRKFSDGTDAVCFSPDGTRLLVGTFGGVAAILDAASGAAIGQPLRHQPGAVYVAFSPDGSLVATASEDKTARLWNARTGEPVGRPLLHKQTVEEVMFSPDGKRLLTTSNDQTAVVWDVATGQPVGQAMHHGNFIWRAEFSPDGRRVLTTSFDGTARLWDADTGQPFSEPMRHGSAVYYGAFSPDGTRVVTASLDHTAQVWDVRRGSRLTPVFRHADLVRDAEFSPDGRTVVTASNDSTAHLWNDADSRALAPAMEHGDYVLGALFSPDGREVVTASKDGTARLWSATNGQPAADPFLHDDAVRCARFSPDGTRIVTAAEYVARVWNLASHQVVGSPMAHKEGLFSARFSPDGKQVATASAEGAVGVWDAATGKPLFPALHQDGLVYDALYAADGKRLVTCCLDGNAIIWDSHTGAPLVGPMHQDNAIMAVAFSPDSTRLVTTSFDHTARLWDAVTGKPAASPLKHGAEVSDAKFSPDGTRVVTASFDSTARLWDAASGLPLTVPMEHANRVSTARFSPDGSRVLTASWDHTARLWDVRTAAGSPPGWFPELAEGVGGKHLGDDDAFGSVPASRVLALRQETLTTPPGDFARFARWFFADRATRTVAPFLDWTVPGFVAAQAEDGTLPALEEALEVQPNDALLLAELARVEPDATRARFDARLAGAAKPAAAVLTQTALAFEHLGDAPAAKDTIDEALRLQPERVATWVARADILWRAGNRPAALAALDRAVQLAPPDAAVLADRGLERGLSGDAAGANADFIAALQLKPVSPEIHARYGWALLHLGDYGRSAQQFKDAGHLGLSGLAACGWQAGAKDPAVDTFLACLRVNRACARANFLRDEAVSLGLTAQELAPLEAVRAGTVSKHPEFKD